MCPLSSDFLFREVFGSARRMASFSDRQRLQPLAPGWKGVVRVAILNLMQWFCPMSLSCQKAFDSSVALHFRRNLKL